MATYESAPFGHVLWGAGVVSTNAEYRAWGAACQAAIAEHLTEVSSTVNWETATLPATANTWTAGDSAIYKFNDGLTEVYIKFEWGRTSTANYGGQWGIRVTIAADEGFALAGGSHYIGDGYTPACSDMMWLSSFGDGCFVLTSTTSTAATYTPATVIVERSRDYQGVPNGDGVIHLLSGPAMNGSAGTVQDYSQRRIVFSPFAVSNTGQSVSFLDPADATLYGNVDVAGPVAWGSQDGHLYQMRSLMAVKATTVPTYSDVTIQRQGEDHVYRSTMFGGSTMFIGASRTLFRWE
jgi:hypothetical protein